MISRTMDFSTDIHHLGISLVACKVCEIWDKGFWDKNDFKYLPYENLKKIESDLSLLRCF